MDELYDFLDSLSDEQREKVISEINLYHHYVPDYIEEDEIEELED